ncbi:serum paraoxonase/arylesterase 2-like [Haliotis cracherodii]|uniref:serum paraoxonase/arylesterase 2-like n=1 Tax=Haliotis cracherodii TaxID=6455 RepID=UPI0039EB2337
MYIKIIVISLLVLLLQHCVKLYFQMDFNKHVFNHYPGPCQQVEGMGFGSEDIHMLPDGRTFITSGIRMAGNAPSLEKFYAQNNIKGRIYLFNMKNPRKVVQEMTLTSTEDFDKDKLQPHGISAWEDKRSGRVFLFVVNHGHDGQEKVEKFLVSFEKVSLQHLKSYHGDSAFRNLNDLVATSEDSFYYTNFLYSESIVGKILESLSFMPWASVGYFDGMGYRIVADGIMMANGIQMSADGRHIYVTASTAHDLRIYERNDDNSLQLREIYPLYSTPDNVNVDPVTGHLYVALHPIYYVSIAHFTDPANRSPSQVLQIKLKDGSVSSVTELFVDDGNLISASTVATVYNKKMLIGSFLDKLVYCDVDVPL